MSATSDIIQRWLTCMGVLSSTLLDLPLRIELPRVASPEEFAEMVEVLKRTFNLLEEEPMLSALEETTRLHLTQAVGDLLLIEEQIYFLLHLEEENSGKAKTETWRYQATYNLLDNAAASLILASESL